MLLLPAFWAVNRKIYRISLGADKKLTEQLPVSTSVPLSPCNSRSYSPYSGNDGLTTDGFPTKVITKITTKLFLIIHFPPQGKLFSCDFEMDYTISIPLASKRAHMLPFLPTGYILRCILSLPPHPGGHAPSSKNMNNAGNAPKSHSLSDLLQFFFQKVLRILSHRCDVNVINCDSQFRYVSQRPLKSI